MLKKNATIIVAAVAGYVRNGNYYDVAPGGERFAMVRPRDQQFDRVELIVVQNFFEELKAKMGN